MRYLKGPVSLSVSLDDVPASEALSRAEAQIYEQTIRATRYNQVQAAKQLGVSRGTLRTKLKQYLPDIFDPS